MLVFEDPQGCFGVVGGVDGEERAKDDFERVPWTSFIIDDQSFREFVGDAVLVGHNGVFDLRFIRLKEPGAGVRYRGPVLDTLALSRFLHDHTPAHSLDAVAQRVGVVVRDRHTALGDALITAQVLLKFIYLLQERGVTTLGQAFAVSGR